MLDNLPEINFIETDINTILNEMINTYQDIYYEQTGIKKTLYPGDPLRIFIYSQALRELNLRNAFNEAAKQNLLAYAKGYFLDQIGVRNTVTRLEAEHATTLMKFTLSAVQSTKFLIPKGFKVSPGNELFFSLAEDTYIPAGETSVEAIVICDTAGEVGNGLLPGQITTIVEPLAYLESVINLDESHGGTDREDDEDFRQRIRLSPEGFSVAGPENAYSYIAKSYSSSIADIKTTSPSDGCVDILVLLKNGEIPDGSFLTKMEAFFSAKDKRPLTDKVTVSAPTAVNYTVDLDYFISSSNEGVVTTIQEKITNAINEYVLWQKQKIGRHINQSELIKLVMAAGASRVVIRNPLYTEITEGQVAICNSITSNFGGVEDD